MRNIYKSWRKKGLIAEISHEAEAMPIIQTFLRQMTSDGVVGLIVEIGTATGGWTLLAHEANPNVSILTFDIDDMEHSRKRQTVSISEVKTLKRFIDQTGVIHRYIGDVFDYDLTNYAVLDTVLRLPIRKLLYCDGGDKKREMLEFGPMLNPGDIIGVHDWVDDVENTKDRDAAQKVYDLLQTFATLNVNSQLQQVESQTRFWMKEAPDALQDKGRT